jgi:tetratricopeptide (TPR) repeat protein
VSRIEELERRVQEDPASVVFGALAEEYRRAGRLEEAVAVCRTGLERHPSYLSARVTLGRALQTLGHVGDARAEFEHVIAVAPDNLAAIRALAELHDAPAAPASPVAPASPALQAWLVALERERAQTSDRL